MPCAKYNLQSERTFETPCIVMAVAVFFHNLDARPMTGKWVCSANIFQVYLAGFILFFSIVLRDCGDPGEPDNAIVIMGNHWAGEYVRYLCNPGYTMIGPAVRRCLPSDKWSGNTPTCKNVNSLQSTRSNVCFLSEKKSGITGIINCPFFYLTLFLTIFL